MSWGEDSILEDWRESREQLGRVEWEAKVLMGKGEEGEEVMNGSGEEEKQYKPVFPHVIWAPGLEASPLATFISPLSWTVFDQLGLTRTQVLCSMFTELYTTVKNCTLLYRIVHHCTGVYTCVYRTGC